MLDGLPVALIEAAYSAAPGNEIASGKFAHPESSACLVANAFGPFLTDPQSLPALPRCTQVRWPALSVRLEAELQFPWRGGMHPWLDVAIEYDNALVAVESKRYEPYRERKQATWPRAYWRDWGGAMASFERLRDLLNSNSIKFERLDAVQLVKHAFGLRTEAYRRAPSKCPVLYYLFAEPRSWPDGRPVEEAKRVQHRAEIETFANFAAGAEVEFQACSYSELLRTWEEAGESRLHKHARALTMKFTDL